MTKAEVSKRIKEGLARKRAAANGGEDLPRKKIADAPKFGFDEGLGTYTLGGLRFEILESDNAREVVRRLNNG